MWKNITCGFDVEDETVNFGTRAVAESEVAVFESNTLATIQSSSPEDQLSSTPTLFAEYYSELGCCLVIDKTVAVLNENCSQTLLCLTFSTTVESVLLVESGIFVLIGVNNGDLYLYHVPSEVRIFTKSFKQTPNGKTFVKIECKGEDDCLQIYVFTGLGQIYRVTNLKLQEVKSACENQDSASVEKLGQDILYKELFADSPLKLEVTLACGFEIDGKYSFLLIGKDIHFRSEDDIHETCAIPRELKLKKVEITQNRSLCFGLTETGKILALCLHTLTLLCVWDELPVTDFTLLDGTENNLLVITGEETCILLLSWPGFNRMFKLQVQPFSHLVYQQISSEDILFVEGFGNDKINTLRLKAIVESQPELRLQRILRKGRFKEAEKFARTFNLNIELVYRAQVLRLMQQLQPWSNDPDSMKAAFCQFMALLEKITDVAFVSECCIKAIPPDFATTHTLLEYGCNRLAKLTSESSTRNEMLQKINAISLRLSIYQQIQGASANSEGWLQFLKADLFYECQKHLKRGEIQEFIFIWSSHWHEIKVKLSFKQALTLLEEDIPTWVKVKDILLWLRHFVQPILSVHPDILKYILQWTMDKIMTLEVLEREAWPDVGLDLAYSVLHLLQVPSSTNDLMPVQDNFAFVSHCPAFSGIWAFIKYLQDIRTLKRDYNVYIPFIDFQQLPENSQDLMMVILERTPVDKLKSLMSNFLKKIMLELNLESDKVISNFIQEIVHSSGDWSLWEEAPWEKTVVVLIPCINEFQKRLECVLLILKEAPIPWSNVIKQIAEDALKLKHPLTNAVQECVDMIPLKLICKKYRFDKIVMTDSTANLVIQNILINYEEMALQDALMIAKSTADKCFSYNIILKHLIKKGNYDAALEIISNLDESDALQCKDAIRASVTQDLRQNEMEKAKHYLEVLPVLCCEENCTLLKKYYLSKVNGTINVSLTNFFFPTTKDKLLNELEGLITKQMTEESIINQIPNYAWMFGTSIEECIISIAMQTVQHNYSLAFSLASNLTELSDLSDDIYCKVLELAMSLMAYYTATVVEEDIVEGVVELICRLSTQCVMYVNTAELISKAWDIRKWFGLLKTTTYSHRSICNDIYVELLPSSTELFSIVQKMLSLYVISERESHGELQSQALVIFENATNNKFIKEDLMKNLMEIVGNSQQHMTGIGLLVTFCWSMSAFSLDFWAEDIEMLMKNKCFDLLKRLNNQMHFDQHTTLDVLSQFHKKEVLLKLKEVEKNMAFNCEKLIPLFSLALTYCKKNRIEDACSYLNTKYNNYLWANKIRRLGIQYKEMLKEGDLIEMLLKIPTITLDFLKDFCLFKRIDFQDTLELYLEEILLSWEPVYEIKTKSSGKKEFLLKNSTDHLKNRCIEIIEMISINEEGCSKRNIDEILQDIWNKVNDYHYEVFLIILELAEMVNLGWNSKFSHYKLLLRFLSTYLRVSEAQSMEIEHWLKLNSSTQNLLPPIAEFRLPFLLLVETDPWKIIRSELNLATYKIWFDVISVLHLDRSTLCSMTIHQLTNNQLSANDSAIDSTNWCLTLRNKSLLAEIKECVSYIANLEMASASLYFVVNHMPPGADQVAAAEMCYLEAQKWVLLEKNEKSMTGYAKVEKKYISVSTYHILHLNQLGEEKYLQLVLKPNDLIYELYHDPRIVTCKSGCIIDLPNINKAVDAIAVLNEINVMNTRFDLLNDWLQASNMNYDISFNDTLRDITLAMLNNRMDPSVAVENENIIRACYLIQSLDKVKAVQYLSAIAFDNTNVLMKIQALQCMCSVATKDLIEKVTGRTYSDVWKTRQSLMFAHEVEKLGLSWLPEKSEIVGLLLDHTSLRALCIAAAICREYNVNTPQHWNTILTRMVALEMINTLNTVLPDLTPYSHILNQEIFRQAWNIVIITPLTKAVQPLISEEREKIEKSIEMFHKCPIQLKIDRAAIREHCQRLQADDLIPQLGHL